MIATLQIPYGYGDCVGGFEYGKEIDQETYIKQLIDDYNYHKVGVDQMMTTRLSHNIAINPFRKEKREYRQQKQSIFSVDCYFSDKNFEPLKIEDLLTFYRQDKSFVIVVQFKDIRDVKKEPDVESDLKMWMSETLKIERTDMLTDIEKFKSFSKKDLKISFRESKMSAVILNTKMVSVYSGNKFALWVDKIRFTDK